MDDSSPSVAASAVDRDATTPVGEADVSAMDVSSGVVRGVADARVDAEGPNDTTFVPMTADAGASITTKFGFEL